MIQNILYPFNMVDHYETQQRSAATLGSYTMNHPQYQTNSFNCNMFDNFGTAMARNADFINIFSSNNINNSNNNNRNIDTSATSSTSSLGGANQHPDIYQTTSSPINTSNSPLVSTSPPPPSKKSKKARKLKSDSNETEPKRKSKRIRTTFTPEQLKVLEHEFAIQMYLVGEYREVLAQSLNLSEGQVKVWFQNRRIKHRKFLQQQGL